MAEGDGPHAGVNGGDSPPSAEPAPKQDAPEGPRQARQDVRERYGLPDLNDPAVKVHRASQEASRAEGLCAARLPDGSLCRERHGECKRHCGAKLRSSRTGSLWCPSAPLAGTTRCKMHGGVGVRGIAHPGFRGAGYSKDLPKYLAKTYRQAVDDPDLLSMRNEVALLHVRLEELTRRLGTPESGRGWAELRAARDRMHEARSIPDAAARGAALARELEVIDRVILHGSEHEANWAEVERAVARKVAVAAREWKRLVDLQQLITAESAMQLVAGIMLAVKEHVTDPNALQGIAQKMRLLLHRPDRPA